MIGIFHKFTSFKNDSKKKKQQCECFIPPEPQRRGKNCHQSVNKTCSKKSNLMKINPVLIVCVMTGLLTWSR